MGKKLIIKGANFYNNRIDASPSPGPETDAQKFQRYIDNLEYLVNLNVTVGVAGKKTYLGIPPETDSRRAIAIINTLVSQSDEIYNRVADSSGMSQVSTLNDEYTFLPIPATIKTVTFGFTDSNYSVGGILLSLTNNKIADSGWITGGNMYTYNISAYDQILWLAFNSKKNTGKFSNTETLQSLGFNIQFTY